MGELSYNVEDVFVTEGVPEITFVPPPNYGEILVDVRRPAKPVIVEGQSGTGKTTTIKQVLKDAFGNNARAVLTPREPSHLSKIKNIDESCGAETFVIDDFHRLPAQEKERIADLAKLIAERDDRSNLPKLIIIGINNVGSDLIQVVPDLAKRLGIHRVQPGSEAEILKIVNTGSDKLNITISDPQRIFEESGGDYWLTLQICKTICLSKNVLGTTDQEVQLDWEIPDIVSRVVATLAHNYDPPVRAFCRGRRFRPTNDPYYKLLKTVASQGVSSIDLNELANANQDVKGSINNVKDRRLAVLIDEKEECSRLFYYNPQTKNFALEDPALFFYLRHLDWEDLRARCGFRDHENDYEFDVAISFAGENRELAAFITEQLVELDVSVFYDKSFEDNYLGGPWSKYFREVFVEKSRLVVVILDKNHLEKMWPTFERDCFTPRVQEQAVVPVFLDDSIFPGIPNDTVAIHFKNKGSVADAGDEIIDNVVLRIAAKLDSM